MPAGRSSSTRARAVDDVQLVAAPPRLERADRRRAPARRARRGRRRRGRGGRPGRRRAGSAAVDSVAAWAMASSVSVAALSTGWRTTSACSDAHASPIAEIESRSPTSTSGSSPAARAWSSPPSAAMTTASRGIGRDGAPVERRGAGDRRRPSVTSAGSWTRFLRRHYPVQVLGSAAAATLSAHRSRELPVLVGHHA